MTLPKDPSARLLTRDKAAKKLGVSITTFRRRYEGKIVTPERIDEGNRALFSPEAIEEVVKEEHPPLTLEEMSVAYIRTGAQAASEALDAGAAALSKTYEVLDAMMAHLIREGDRKDTRIAALESRADEIATMLDEARKHVWDETIAKGEADKAVAKTKAMMDTFKLLAPAVAAALLGGKTLKDVATGSLYESLTQEQKDLLVQGLAGVLTPDQMAAFALILQQRDAHNAKDTAKDKNGAALTESA